MQKENELQGKKDPTINFIEGVMKLCWDCMEYSNVDCCWLFAIINIVSNA